MVHEHMSDKELDVLLARASAPALPKGFEQRLLQRVAEEQPAVAASNVIAFPSKAAKPRLIQWLAVVPMAAALAGGFYVGLATDLPEALTQGNVVTTVAGDDFTIFDDLDFVLQDGQS